jgi:senataxin
MFERLLQQGHPSQLMLGTQYRMHPSISSWPARTFYGGLLQDGTNVLQPGYGAAVQQLLELGPYAFVDVTEVRHSTPRLEAVCCIRCPCSRCRLVA